MHTNSVVRARVDEETKAQARAVLAAMGLTISDALRMLLIRIANERTLPFEPFVPNATTVKAMRDARRGKTVKHPTIADLMADLHEDH
jgi:DNA-damage-inducible protein J|nr:type II toxin-antitoxin system RelB/DinJ family antitoxin [Oxalobacteraceae bacterium]